MTRFRATDEEFLKKLTDIVVLNLQNENFGTTELSRISGMSPSGLNRKLRSILNKNINQFIRGIRLQKAMEMLQNEAVTASEVSYRVGFSSPAYFNTCFNEHFGFPPGKVRFGDNEPVENKYPSPYTGTKNRKNLIRKIISKSGSWKLIISVSALAGIILLSGIFKKDVSDDLASDHEKISVTVMPFANVTTDTELDNWQYAIQINIINLLSDNEELNIQQIENINGLISSRGITNYASISPSIARSISKKLNSRLFVTGSINKEEKALRLNAQLLDSRTEEVLRSYQIDGNTGSLLDMIDSLSIMIENSIIISQFKNIGLPSFHEAPLRSTNDPQAYYNYIMGQVAFYKNDFPTAEKCFSQALEFDSTLYAAMAKIAISYYNENKYEEGKYWCLKNYNNLDKLHFRQQIWAKFLYAIFFETPKERIKFLEQLLLIDDQQPLVYFDIGDSYLELFQYDKAIANFEKALEIFEKWESKPFWGAFYYELGQAYHKDGQYAKERKLYRKGQKDFPDDPEMLDQQAWLALTYGDSVSAKKYIDKWINIRKDQSWSDSRIASYIGYIYDMAGLPDKEEEYRRKALNLEPENPARMNSLAYFLIDTDRNTAEGVQLVDKALELKPDDYSYLHTKGWGLYKQGVINEGLELLEKSWELRRDQSVYNHLAYIHLEEARKAAAVLK